MASFHHRRRHGTERLIAALAALGALTTLTTFTTFATPPAIAAAGPAPPVSAATTPTPAALLALAAIEVEPARPRPATLCRLRVRIENRGERTASALAFAVILGGREVPAVSHRVYLVAIPPGQAITVRLPNFWSSEGGRPVPPTAGSPSRSG